MIRPRVYLDHNATAPLRPTARDAMMAAFELTGNASSIHAEGRRARALIEGARATVAAWLGVGARQVVFTSGGTESANLALAPSLSDGHGSPVRLLVSAVEHRCVLDGHRFAAEAVTTVAVDSDGRLDLEALDRALENGQGRPLLALQAANNETGAIQPVAEATRRVHARGGLVFCDAVQACGRMAVTLADLGADILAVSAHKFGGPKGVGALVFGYEGFHIGKALVRGGGQERGFRAGTENVAAIAGFAAAFGDVSQGEWDRVGALRDQLEAALLADAAGVVVLARNGPRLPNTATVSVPGLKAETALMRLDLDGIAVSSGSACSSGKVGPSHVLAAMGLRSDVTGGAVRISLGWSSTADDVARFCAAFAKMIESKRGLRAAA